MQLTGKQCDPSARKGYCNPPSKPCIFGKDNESCAFKTRRKLVQRQGEELPEAEGTMTQFLLLCQSLPVPYSSPQPHSLLEEAVLCLKGNHRKKSQPYLICSTKWSPFLEWLLTSLMHFKHKRQQKSKQKAVEILAAQIHRDLLAFSAQH